MWKCEHEDDGYQQIELSSPTDLSEEEVNFVIAASKTLAGQFYGGRESATHVHVQARCLLHEDRLVPMLLMWERFHTAITKLIQARPWAGERFAMSMADKHPLLMAELQQRWLQATTGVGLLASNLTQESLNSLFRRHAQFEGGQIRNDRDGYRRMALNVCHLLHVNCCLSCEKNAVPKFGAVEFRVFNTEFGEPLRLLVALAERLVQTTCTKPLDELQPFLLLPGSEQSPDAAPLIKFLKLDPAAFHRVFRGYKDLERRCNASDHQ